MTQIRHSIRNIDPEMIMEARLFSVRNRQPLGETITEAIDFYLENIVYDDSSNDQNNVMQCANREA